MSSGWPVPGEPVARGLLLQPHRTGLIFYAVLFGILPHWSFFSSPALLDLYGFLGPGVALLPVAQNFAFDRHPPKLDFLSPVTCAGTPCPRQANFGSFVTKTLWRW